MRYALEWIATDGNPYGVPPDLEATPLSELTRIDGDGVKDHRWTLDGIADRIGRAVVERAKIMGVLP